MILNLDQIKKIEKVVGPDIANEFLKQQKTEKDKEKEQKKRRLNKDFTQVYPAGWYRIQSLLNISPSAARVYVFLAENIGPDGAVCASRKTLAEALKYSEKTISRHTKTLEKEGAIVILKLGTANVYCLNPGEVWKSFSEAKSHAAFNTKTLVSKSENPFVKKRLATLVGKDEGTVKEEDFELYEDVDKMLQVADDGHEKDPTEQT